MMIFQINFYPEYARRRAERRRRAAFAAGASGILALELFLVLWIALSGYLARERASRLDADIARLSARVEEAGEPEWEQEELRGIAAARRRRMDWTPKLSALSCLVDRSVMLIELKGNAGRRGSPGKLEIEGRLLNRSSQNDAVAGFVERVRDEPRITDGFPVITLGRLEGSGSGQFNIVCQPGRAGS